RSVLERRVVPRLARAHARRDPHSARLRAPARLRAAHLVPARGLQARVTDQRVRSAGAAQRGLIATAVSVHSSLLDDDAATIAIASSVPAASVVTRYSVCQPPSAPPQVKPPPGCAMPTGDRPAHNASSSCPIASAVLHGPPHTHAAATAASNVI